jgi:proteic killer suppression protein
MIKSFKDSETEKIHNLTRSQKLPNDIQQIALRKRRMLTNAKTINDLRVPSANLLEKLVGNRAGLLRHPHQATNGEFVLIGGLITLTMWR